ncbi:putative NBD/HSP70 family sugar kinase [Humibacillus xanthopallidus]|uniref:Putative NBD/HSP70 family sugar kinase n=1 Tax=Humibacillus xanthopallidus TaxID=412689 RepID=A0A543PNY5_9MICO|nr:putative NBD/HSP70 family sugar kinase [Humibacillus xanthopallidus]
MTVSEGSASRFGARSTADQMSVRRHNLSVVLNHLRLHGGRSRARIAAETGLNKATVSSLVAELLARGLVREGEIERGSVGRPGQTIELDAHNFIALGAEVAVDYVSVIATNLRGEPVSEQRLALDTARLRAESVLGRLAGLVDAVIDPLAAAGAVPVGLTLALPGITDPASGLVWDAPNLGWHETAVLEPLRRHLGDPAYPLLIENEANAAVLAELDVRGRTAPPDLLLITGATGVGGGIVTGGRLLRGSRGFAGELGHMQVDPAGRRCRCGRVGCFETVVGLGALLRALAPADDPVRDPSIDVVQRLDEVRSRLEAGDPRALAAVEQIGDGLVQGCGSLVNIFNPGMVVLGGYFAALGQWFAPRLRSELDTEVFAPKSGGCRIELSTLGFSGAVRGGALRATRHVFDEPGLVPYRADAGQLSGAMS